MYVMWYIYNFHSFIKFCIKNENENLNRITYMYIADLNEKFLLKDNYIC